MEKLRKKTKDEMRVRLFAFSVKEILNASCDCLDFDSFFCRKCNVLYSDKDVIYTKKQPNDDELLCGISTYCTKLVKKHNMFKRLMGYDNCGKELDHVKRSDMLERYVVEDW